MRLENIERLAVCAGVGLLACLVGAAPPAAAPAGKGEDPQVAALAQEVRGKGWVVFSARTGEKGTGNRDLFVMRTDGSDLRNITNTPDFQEAAPQFSRDGKRLLYRRLENSEDLRVLYGLQGELVFSDSDGRNAQVYGKKGEYPWASWGPDGKQIACLSKKNGVFFVDIASRQIVRKLDRKGFFEQTVWSPDGEWIGDVSNGFRDFGWCVARMEVATGEFKPVDTGCTPDWFPDSNALVFSKRPGGQKANNGHGWTQLWVSDAEGKNPRMLYGEEGRHCYGGLASPDGKYIMFAGGAIEDGNPRLGAPQFLMRLADAPIIVGESKEFRALHPKTNAGPLLPLPAGHEPSWTAAEIFQTQRAKP